MSPEGLPLLAVCPAKHLDKTFPENFLRQRGFCQGWDYEMARAEGNASDHLPQKPTKVNLRRLGNENRREMTEELHRIHSVLHLPDGCFSESKWKYLQECASRGIS